MLKQCMSVVAEDTCWHTQMHMQSPSILQRRPYTFRSFMILIFRVRSIPSRVVEQWSNNSAMLWTVNIPLFFYPLRKSLCTSVTTRRRSVLQREATRIWLQQTVCFYQMTRDRQINWHFEQGKSRIFPTGTPRLLEWELLLMTDFYWPWVRCGEM